LGPAPKPRNAVKCYLFAHKSAYVRHSFVVLEQMPINFEWKVKNNNNNPSTSDTFFKNYIPKGNCFGNEKALTTNIL
jgi:hypothetical protein